MRIHNLYADENGESHFRDIEIEWVEERASGLFSKKFPATGMIFREMPLRYDNDWHTAPNRQYNINLDADQEIVASDGETRVIKAGEIILIEDTTGKGHIARTVGGVIRHCVYVTLE